MGDERTDRVDVADGSAEAVVAVPEDGSGSGVLLTFCFPARIQDG